MSTGYLVESPMMVPVRPDAAAILRSVNDLAAVWKANTKPEGDAALVAWIRRIGPAYFLPASDWPFQGSRRLSWQRLFAVAADVGRMDRDPYQRRALRTKGRFV
jgi:hypothetical protein